MSYTDQLTPKQVRHLLFEIGALQPDQYKWSIPDTEITLCPDETPILISGRIYLNTVTGLWTSSNDGSGDVIGLIGLRFGHSNTEAIKWANKVLGVKHKPKAKAIELERFERIPRSAASSNLKGNEKVIFGNIIARCGNKTYCFVGRERIAKDCGVSTRTVDRAIDTLESVGLLEQYSRGFNKPKYKVPVIRPVKAINRLLKMIETKASFAKKLRNAGKGEYFHLDGTDYSYSELKPYLRLKRAV